MFSISLESFEVKEFEEEYKKFVVAVNDFAEDIFSDPCLWLAEAEFRVLYQINGIIIVLFFLICYSKHMKNTKHGVLPHFSIEALKQRYLACECPRERMRWHAIWLLADTEHPRTPREVADIVGCTADCVRKLRRHYNVDGEEALRDKRKTNGGRPFLDAPQQAF